MNKLPEPPITLTSAERRLYDDQGARMKSSHLWTDAKVGLLAQWAQLTLEVEKLKKLYRNEPATVKSAAGTDKTNPKVASLERKEKELRKTADRLLAAPRMKTLSKYQVQAVPTPRPVAAAAGPARTFQQLAAELEADPDPYRYGIEEEGEALGDLFDTGFTPMSLELDGHAAYRVQLQEFAMGAQNLLIQAGLRPDEAARFAASGVYLLPLPATLAQARQHLASPHARASLRNVPAYVARVNELLQAAQPAAEGVVAPGRQKARQRPPVPTAGRP